MKKWIIFACLWLISSVGYARSLKASADQLSTETTRIGLGLGVFGLALAAIYFILGRNDAGTKMTQALLGILVLLLAPSIVDFMKVVA